MQDNPANNEKAFSLSIRKTKVPLDLVPMSCMIEAENGVMMDFDNTQSSL